MINKYENDPAEGLYPGHRRRADAAAQRLIMALDARARDQRQNRLTPTQARLAGALFSYCGPRLAFDAELPDLDDAVRGVDRLRGRRRMVADRVRKAMAGRVARDADLDDLEMLLQALEDREEGEDDELSWEEIDGGPPPDVDATDRRMTPYRNFDRKRRVGRDEPPPFSGRPRPGGRMDPLRDEEPEAWDRGRRRHAHDSATPQPFSDRFKFTRNVVADNGSVPVRFA